MPIFLFTLATIFWGCSFVFIKLALYEVSSLSFVFWRFLLASLSLLPFLGNEYKKIDPQVLYKGAHLGLLLGGLMCFQTIGLQTIGASESAFLLSFSSVFVLAVRFLAQKQFPSIIDLSATLVCIGGLALVTQGHGIGYQPGVFYSLLSTLFVALHIYALEHYVKGASLVVLTLVQMLVLTLLAGVCVWLFEGGFVLPVRAVTWVGIIATAVLCSSLAFAIQAYAQQHLDAFKISMFTMLEPIFAVIFSWLILGEVPHLFFYIGATMILGAIGVINWRLIAMEQQKD